MAISRIAVAGAIAGSAALLVAGCSTTASPSASQSEPGAPAADATRAAAGVKACPDLWGPKDAPSYADISTQYTVPITFVNNSSQQLTVNASEIDCYDFSGTDNPSAFDGAVIAPGATSGPYNMLARRTCAYIKGDIIGKFQEREANWKTTISATGYPSVAGTLPTTISCSSTGQEPTMCPSGTSQNKASYAVKMPGGTPLRAAYVCHGGNITITLTDLY